MDWAVLRGEDLGQDGVAVAAVQALEEVVREVVDQVAGEEGIGLQGIGVAWGEELAGGVVHVVDVADRRQADAALVERGVRVEQVLLVSAHLDAGVEDASGGVANEGLDAFGDVAGVNIGPLLELDDHRVAWAGGRRLVAGEHGVQAQGAQRQLVLEDDAVVRRARRGRRASPGWSGSSARRRTRLAPGLWPSSALYSTASFSAMRCCIASRTNCSVVPA